MINGNRPRVVIVGAGFGGLYAARTLANQDVDVLLIDRENFHTFTPLLYQVATSALDPSEIAYPVRTIFHKNRNIRFLWGEVSSIDRERKHVLVDARGTFREEPYDYLILAAGSVTNFFGNQEAAEVSFELKALPDAVVLRNHILKLFERAAWAEDAATRDRLTTMVVVGGGATGLETAGALYELYNDVLAREFPDERLKTRVILIEASDRLLAPYPEKLQQAALRQVESIGVEVIFGNPVVAASPTEVTLKDGTVIPTNTLVWAAGVAASPLGERLGVKLGWQRRVPVKPTLEVIGCEDIYVVGDMAYLEDPHGKPYPGVIQVAKQQSIRAAQNILCRLSGEPQAEFVYQDLGTMATIGRSRAVAWLFNRIPLSGFLAWMAWVLLHLVMLMGFRNRLNVFVNWMWNYFTYDRSVRIILEHQPRPLFEPTAEPAGEPVPDTGRAPLAPASEAAVPASTGGTGPALVPAPAPEPAARPGTPA
ncbi:MAG TPA: NAD(P)/FAD-dependent oxidoreductase [Haliangium sp.]|nr:NAD(P)/FAD-dependent oxidoreductase [Haliangium sp.]